MVFINHIDILDGRATIVSIEGPLTGETSPDFEHYINTLLQRKQVNILLDAGKIEFVSSAGIGVMLVAHRNISSKKGNFIIFNISGEMLSLYTVLGFDKIFRIARTRIEAMEMVDGLIDISSSAAKPESSIEAEPDKEDPAISASVEDLNSGKKTDFAQMIVECINCKALVKVKSSGDYICPDCKSEFTVYPDQTVVF